MREGELFGEVWLHAMLELGDIPTACRVYIVRHMRWTLSKYPTNRVTAGSILDKLVSVGIDREVASECWKQLQLDGVILGSEFGKYTLRDDFMSDAPLHAPLVAAKEQSSIIAEPVVKFDQKSRFEEAWKRYPSKDGRKAAINHFNASVKDEETFQKLLRAIDNYLKSPTVARGFIKHGSTFFNNWQDWIEYSGEPDLPLDAVQAAKNKASSERAAALFGREPLPGE